MLLIEQLEAFHARDRNDQSCEAQVWHGNDSDKLWLRSEGERGGGKLKDGNLEAVWHHNSSAYWGRQPGLRHDFGTGPAPGWALVALQGLAPYWFEVDVTGYLGHSGHTAARRRIGYEMLFTQHLICRPNSKPIHTTRTIRPAESVAACPTFKRACACVTKSGANSRLMSASTGFIAPAEPPTPSAPRAGAHETGRSLLVFVSGLEQAKPGL